MRGIGILPFSRTWTQWPIPLHDIDWCFVRTSLAEQWDLDVAEVSVVEDVDGLRCFLADDAASDDDSDDAEDGEDDESLSCVGQIPFVLSI